MLKFLSRYICLAPEAAAILTAFALVSHFVDCFPLAPVIFLSGPGNETGLVLRLLGCLCRRPILLSDVDVKALATLPNELGPTLLIHNHQLTRAVSRVLVASNDRHFRIARGKGQLHTHGAKALLGNPGFVTGTGLRISVPPSLDQLSTLTDEDGEENGKPVSNEVAAISHGQSPAYPACSNRCPSLRSCDARSGPYVAGTTI